MKIQSTYILKLPPTGTMWPDILVFFNISNSLHSVLSIWMQRKLKTPQPLTLFESNGCFLFEHAVICNTSPFKVIKKRESYNETSKSRCAGLLSCVQMCVCVYFYIINVKRRRETKTERKREEKKNMVNSFEMSKIAWVCLEAEIFGTNSTKAIQSVSKSGTTNRRSIQYFSTLRIFVRLWNDNQIIFNWWK